MAEDKLLIQSWLNISKDPLVGVDQKAERFWLKIKENYNKYRGDLRERDIISLKSRWHKINHAVSKFAGCYKSAVQRRKSECSENDIISDAKMIWAANNITGEQFKFEHAWWLLRDEPKWIGESSECSLKRTKTSTPGAYSSSSNPSDPTSCDYDPSSPTLIRPIGKKRAKRKAKTTVDDTAPSNVNYDAIQETLIKRVEALNVIATLKKEENDREKERILLDKEKVRLEQVKLKMDEKREKQRQRLENEKLKAKELKILMTDTSQMPKSQRRDHEVICNMIREKYGIV